MKPVTLNGNLIYLCGQFSHRFSLMLAKRFEEEGIHVTPEQFAILVVLWYKDGITQKEISEQLGRDKTTVARVVGNMKNKGTVKQVVDENDNRARLIYLTKKGRNIQQAALNVSGSLYMQATTGIDENIMSAGVQLMQQMLVNL